MVLFGNVTWRPGADSRERVGHRRRDSPCAARAIAELHARIVCCTPVCSCSAWPSCFLPVAARNRIVGGEWHLTTSQFGPNLYIGNNPNADGTYGALREGRGSPEYERQDATEIAEAAAGRRLTPGEVSSFWVRQTMEFVRSQPGAWLTLMGTESRASLESHRVRGYGESGQLRRLVLVALALAPVGHFGILVPLAVLGIIATWRDRSRAGVYYAIAAAYAASVVLFYVSARYRMPLVPLLILFAAAGLASLTTFLRTAVAPKIAAAAATIGAVMIVANLPLLSANLMRATTETNLGVALQTDGRLHEAETHYRRALAIQPDHAPAYVNLGMVLVALHRPDEAIEAYKRAIELESGDVDLDMKLGNALLQAGRAPEAVERFRRAIAAGRGSAETFGALFFRAGSLLVEREQFREAIDVFRAGLALVPESPQGHNNLGGALAASGRTAEAIVEFEQALRLDPNLVSARRNLELLRRKNKKG